MRVYRSFGEVNYDKNTILTVGSFDGVHKGHQTILKTLVEESSNLGLRNLVMTFNPHPQQVIRRKDKGPIELLSTINERIKLFEKYGISNLLIIPFTYEFSQTPPDVFIREFIVKKVGVSIILIGYDHLFGKNREGNLNLLKAQGERFDFTVQKMDAKQEKDLIISSTKIRDAIKSGQLKLANELLGHNYFAMGTVVVGDKRGRTIGFPTANLKIEDDAKLLPPNGVYFVKVIVDSNEYYGMTNIGLRPTFNLNEGRTFETHIFDFDKEIYGKEITVEFIEFIRNEQKFNSIDELITQLNSDKKLCLGKIAP